MSETTEIDFTAPPAEELFVLELGDNGGTLAPTSGTELRDWLSHEIHFWQWLSKSTPGNHKGAIDNAVAPLNAAYQNAQQGIQYETSNSTAFSQHVQECRQNIEDAYLRRKLPHSSSSLGKRVEEIQKRDVMEAIAYLFCFLPSGGHQFDAKDPRSWRGFIEGLVERFGIGLVPEEALAAALRSVDDLRAKYESVLGKKTQALKALQRKYDKLHQEIANAKSEQAQGFATFIDANQKTHDDALNEHKEEMKRLEAVFKENMALRAPVMYWEGRKSHHDRRAARLIKVVFGAMAALAGLLGLLAWWVLSNLTDGKPEAWRVTLLVLIGVLGVWAVRLLVRMFLSDAHLATDAAERVTMVQTYLSLLESEKLPSDDDRKLILQSLFRPASDGIVKDEGLPHPALEALTRIGGRT